MLIVTFRNRYFRTLLTGLLLLALFPICSAYADDFEGGDGGSHNTGGSYPNFGTVWYGPKAQVVNGDNKVRYGVVAYTQYDAAVYCCIGSSTLDFGRLSAKKKQKLLAESDFYSFANLFKVGKPELTTDNWSGDAEIVLAWNSARVLYGETYCYNAIYDDVQINRATDCIRRILNEDDSSSGGGIVSAGDSWEYAGKIYTPVVKWSDESLGTKVIDCFRTGTSWFNDLKAYADEHDQKIYALIGRGCYQKTTMAAQATYATGYIFTCPPDNIEYNDEDYSISFKTSFDSYMLGKRYDKDSIDSSIVARDTGSNGTKNCLDVDSLVEYGGVVTIQLGIFQWPTSNVDSVTGNYKNFEVQPIWYISEIGDVTQGGGGGEIDPDPDPPTWPTPPTVSTEPPDVPTPGDPTTPTPPDPVNPTPGNPWIPIPGETVDITGEDFQDLIDALDEHCQHLQASIQSNVSQLWNLQSDFLSNQFTDLFSSFDSYFGWLGTDVIVASFTDLKAYLKELFDWLSERMDFNIQVEGGEYDDTSVVYWLKQIWSKLGDGINTQPTDPVVESDDWWAWLLALMGNFVAMLLAFGADKLGDVTNAVQTLSGKFPFCLPWDLAAMFALLDATPVIPSFDLPCFALTSGGLTEVGQYHITLEAFDGVWEGIRWVERLGFVVMLIRYTDKLMAVMRRAVGR